MERALASSLAIYRANISYDVWTKLLPSHDRSSQRRAVVIIASSHSQPNCCESVCLLSATVNRFSTPVHINTEKTGTDGKPAEAQSLSSAVHIEKVC